MAATHYYIVAAILAALTAGGHLANYILTLRMRADVEGLRSEVREWARTEFVTCEMCRERHAVHSHQIGKLEARLEGGGSCI